MNRASSIAKAQNETFDVCIIGGGITGAGILARAIQKGWKAILVEKQDFASGTSSRSSKMIHGGLRYLKMFQFKMVYEALHEREYLLKTFPTLVKPLPFIMPVYHSTIFLNVMALFIRFYGKLAGHSMLRKAKKLSATEVLKRLPGIKQKSLKGGVLYWDGWVNDSLLTIEVIKSCWQKGAVVLNYCKASKIIKESDVVQHIECVDNINNNRFNIKAKIYINATGVWTDDILRMISDKQPLVMKPSKGVHILVPASKIPSDNVAIVQSGFNDKRYVYAFPWEYGLTVLGTTDTEYNGHPDKVATLLEDAEYLLNSFNKNFPAAQLSASDIMASYVGLRPMLDDKNRRTSYLRSREYSIWWNSENFLNIAGGKLTSFLSMGKKCMDIAEKKLKRSNNFSNLDTQGFCETTVEKLVKENAALGKSLFEKLNLTGAEVIQCIRDYFALEPANILTRRSSVTYAMKYFDKMGATEVAKIMAEELNKSNEWIEMQVKKYYTHWQEYHPDFIY